MNKKLFSLVLVAIFIASSFAVPLVYANALNPGEGSASSSSNVTSERANYVIVLNPPDIRRLYIQYINITFPSGFDISNANVPMAFGIPTRRSTVNVDVAHNTIEYDFGRRYRLRANRLAVIYVSGIQNAPTEGTFNVQVKLIDRYGVTQYTYTLPVFITYVDGSMIEDHSITGDDIDPTTSITIAGLTVNGLTTTQNLEVTDTVDSDLIPGGSFDLGASGSEWANLYAENGYFSNQVQVGSTVTITTDSITGSGSLDIAADNGLTLTPGTSSMVLKGYDTVDHNFVDALTITPDHPPKIDVGVHIDMNHHDIIDVNTIHVDNVYLDYMIGLHNPYIKAQSDLWPISTDLLDLGDPSKEWLHVYSKYGNFSKAVEIGHTITIDGVDNFIRSSDEMLIEVMAGSAPLDIEASNLVLDGSEANFFVNVDMNGNKVWDSTGDLRLDAASDIVHVMTDHLQVGSSIWIDNALNTIYSDNAARFTIASANNQALTLSAGSPGNYGNLEAYGYDVSISADHDITAMAANAITLNALASSVSITGNTDVNIGALTQDISLTASASILQNFGNDWVASGPYANFTLTDSFEVLAPNLLNLTSPIEVEVNAQNNAHAGLLDVNADTADIDVFGATTLDTATFAITATGSGAITTPTWYINATGGAWFNNNLDVEGNTELGDNLLTDKVVFKAKVYSDILPGGLYDLGATGDQWDNVFARYGNFSQQVKVGSSVLITTDTISASGGLTIQTASGNDLNIQAPSATVAVTGNLFTIDANNIDLSSTEMNLYVPLDMNGNSIYDSMGYVNLADDVNLGADTSDVIQFTGRVNSHIIPASDNAYDLGENTTPLRFRTGYFGTSVVVGSSVTITTNAISASDTLGITSQNAMTISSTASTVTVEDVIFNSNSISTTSGNLVLDSAAGTTQINDDLDLNGNADVSGTLNVAGAATLGSTLTVSGLSNLNGGIDVNSGMFTVDAATGNTAIAGTLNVAGAATLSGGVTVSSGLTTDTLHVTSTSQFDGDATFSGTIYADGGISTTAGSGLDLNLASDSGTVHVTVDTLKVGSSIYVDNNLNKIYSDNTAAFVVESFTDQDLTVSAPGSGNVNLNADTGDVMVTGDVFATLDNTYDLGSQTARWHSLYLGNAMQIVSSPTNYITVDITGISSTGVALTIASDAGTGITINSGNDVVDFSGDSLQNVNVLYADQLMPSGTNKFIGSAASHWSQLHVDSAWIYGPVSLGGDLNMNGNDILNVDELTVDTVHPYTGTDVTFTGNIVPSPSGTLTLGSTSNRWHALYLGSTIDAADTLDINVAAGNVINLQVGGTTEYTFSSTAFDVGGNDITNVNELTASTAHLGTIDNSGSDIVFGDNLDLNGHKIKDTADSSVEFGSSIYIDYGNNKIYSDDTNPFVVESADDQNMILNAPVSAGTPAVKFQVGGTDKVIVSSTVVDFNVAIDMNGNNINSIGTLDFGGHTLTWDSGNTRFDFSDDVHAPRFIAGSSITIDSNTIQTDAANQLTLQSGSGDVLVNDGLTVSGATTLGSTLSVTGTLSANGDVNLGDSSSDTINFNGVAGTALDMNTHDISNVGTLTATTVSASTAHLGTIDNSGSDITIGDNLAPDSSTLTLGTSSNRWGGLYLASPIDSSSDLTIIVAGSTRMTIGSTAVTMQVPIDMNGQNIDMNSGTLTDTDGTVDIDVGLDVDGNIWTGNTLYTDNLDSVSGSGIVVNDYLDMNGNIITDTTGDLLLVPENVGPSNIVLRAWDSGLATYIDALEVVSGLSTEVDVNTDLYVFGYVSTDDLDSYSGSGITVHDDLLPSGAIDLGSSASQWDELYVSTTHVGTIDNSGSDITIGDNLAPDSSTLTLGTSSNRWGALYLASTIDTSTSLNIDFSGTTEYTFSSSAFDVGGNDITNVYEVSTTRAQISYLHNSGNPVQLLDNLDMNGNDIIDTIGNIQLNDDVDVSGVLTVSSGASVTGGLTTDTLQVGSSGSSLTLIKKGTSSITGDGSTTSFVISDSSVTTSSIIIVVFSNDPGSTFYVVSGTGQFTINFSSAPAAATYNFVYLVIN